MRTHRTRAWVLAGLLVALSATMAAGQNLDLFGPADLSTYGGGPDLREGVFFVYDGLAWAISTPDVTPIGLGGTFLRGPDNTVTAVSTVDTGSLFAEIKHGQRIETGIVCDGSGWLMSTFQLTHQQQKIFASDAHVLFRDPNFEFPPDEEGAEVVFSELTARNDVEVWGVELMRLWRLEPFDQAMVHEAHPLEHLLMLPWRIHRGGTLELMIGARYLEFNEDFDVDGRGGVLDKSRWNTVADNNIVGPQVAARLFKSQGRWTVSAEGRYFAGFNFQTVRQSGTLADQRTPLPLSDLPASFKSSFYAEEFGNAAELRLMFSYQLTRAVAFRVGWTGFYADGIARPSNMVDYTLHYMGILASENRQDIFINGLNVGVEVNR